MHQSKRDREEARLTRELAEMTIEEQKELARTLKLEKDPMKRKGGEVLERIIAGELTVAEAMIEMELASQKKAANDVYVCPACRLPLGMHMANMAGGCRGY